MIAYSDGCRASWRIEMYRTSALLLSLVTITVTAAAAATTTTFQSPVVVVKYRQSRI